MKMIKILLPGICVLSFFSCGSNASRSVQINPPSGVNNDRNDTLYQDDSMIVVKTTDSADTLLKFNSDMNDAEYAVEPQTLKLTKALDFSDYEYKKMFITRTKETVKEQGVNFAGHFCLAYWGCGSPCKLSAVVDMKTGKVYNGLPSEVGYEFRKDSKLLIINPPDSTGWYNKNIGWQQPAAYIWTGKSFVKK